MCWRQKKHHRSRIIQLVFYWKNIEVCAKAHGQIWPSRPQVTLWSAYLRDWDSRQATTLMAQRVGLSGLRSKMASSSSTSTTSLFTTSGFRTQKGCLILISFNDHLAFRGAHMRICDAKTVRLEGRLNECSLKLKLMELSYWRSLMSLKSK